MHVLDGVRLPVLTDAVAERETVVERVTAVSESEAELDGVGSRDHVRVGVPVRLSVGEGVGGRVSVCPDCVDDGVAVKDAVAGGVDEPVADTVADGVADCVCVGVGRHDTITSSACVQLCADTPTKVQFSSAVSLPTQPRLSM